MGNPFQEDSCDLLSLDTKDIAHRSVIEMVCSHYEKGKDRFQPFMTNLEEEEATFYEPIHENRIDFFRQELVSDSTSKQKILKDNCHLFSKLFISCQSRECDLKEFFRHETQKFPAALSDGGKLHSCQKSQLATILESLVTIPRHRTSGGCHHHWWFRPRSSKTFEDYAVNDVLSTIQACSTKYKRTNSVFDAYLTSSLKFETRSKRGRGVRRRVTSKGKLLTNWRNFLRDNDNKTALFNYLADTIGQIYLHQTWLLWPKKKLLATTASAYMTWFLAFTKKPTQRSLCMTDVQQKKAVK